MTFHPAFRDPKAKHWTQHEHSGAPFVVAFTQTSLLTLAECDLDVKQAAELRDWLNSVLPERTAGE